MIILPPQAIGSGYRQLQIDEPILTTDEWFSVMHEKAGQRAWRASSYWTSEGKTHTGRVPYRRAVGLKARIAVRLRLVTKVWRWVGEPVTKTAEVAAPGPLLPGGLSEPITKARWRWWFGLNP